MLNVQTFGQLLEVRDSEVFLVGGLIILPEDPFFAFLASSDEASFVEGADRESLGPTVRPETKGLCGKTRVVFAW